MTSITEAARRTPPHVVTDRDRLDALAELLNVDPATLNTRAAERRKTRR